MIRDRPDLIVIGITGSYGKTSTKEYLAQILSQKYKVLKTEKSNNTDIGIAQAIVNNLKPEHEVFIVEMGAYKRGEIKTICEIVKPKIGIITAINEQHLDLFGSIENTMRAKYELVEALPLDGVAVFNFGNSYTRKMAKKSEIKTLAYEIDEGRTLTRVRPLTDDGKIMVRASNIIVNIDSLQFTLSLGKESIRIAAQMAGRQHIENILAASSVAHELGMTLKEVAWAIEELTPPSMTMNIIKHKSGAYLVDDTFNVSPDSVLAALDYLEIHRAKKVLVLQPMIELGQATQEAHQRVGERAAEVCDFIILTNKNFSEWFINGVNEGNKKEGKTAEVKIAGGDFAVSMLIPYLTRNNAIVFESKEAGKILAKIL